MTCVTYQVNLSNGVPIDNLVFYEHRGLLKIDYTGGDKTTDSFAVFATNMSALICSSCGKTATRRVFLHPRCEDCI